MAPFAPARVERRAKGLTGYDRSAAVCLSLAAHLAMVGVLLFSIRLPPVEPPPQVVAVDIIVPPPPPAAAPPTPAPPAPTPPAAATPPPKHVAKVRKLKRAEAPIHVKALAADEDEGPPAPTLSESDLAGAAVAGEGSTSGGGGTCDMARLVQAALRKDPLVRAAVAVAARTGHPLLVWNGDWVRDQGDDGKGLQAVREAILWEVGFAPAACRAQAMRGLVLMRVSEGRIVIGTGAWRWSDLLRAR